MPPAPKADCPYVCLAVSTALPSAAALQASLPPKGLAAIVLCCLRLCVVYRSPHGRKALTGSDQAWVADPCG